MLNKLPAGVPEVNISMGFAHDVLSIQQQDPRRDLINAGGKLSVVGHQVYETCQHERQIHSRVLPILEVVFSEMTIWLVEMPVHSLKL